MGSFDSLPPHGPGEFASDGVYSIPNVPMGTARHLKIICIGAGASGINLAFQVREHMRNIDFVIYEKNDDVGGTWYENRYPGCACDIPAHNYQFSWAENPNWSEFYATSTEICEYLTATSHKDETSQRVFAESCHFLFNGGGYLNNWKWPSINGLETFKGDLVHTAHWTEDIDLCDKRVGVIGNGSSGMQVLAAIHPDVKSLVSFSRSPTWVTPTFASEFAGKDGGNFQYSEKQKRELAQDLKAFLKYRKALEKAMTGNFEGNLKDSEMQRKTKEELTEHMKSVLKDDTLIQSLVPEFGVGCRRPTPGLGYLETLTKPNVRLVTDNITEIVPQGIKTATGEVIEMDAIVCATGFDYSWIPKFPIMGRNYRSLGELWEKRPTAYLGLAVNELPNYFVFLGPSSPLSHGSALPTIEAVTKYMLRIVWKAQTESYKAVVPSSEAVHDFVHHNDTFHQKTIWGTKCRSWLKGGTEDGKVLTHPGSRIQNIHCLLNPRYEDWVWTPLAANRFAFMGNGMTVLEEDRRDATWYMNDHNAGYEGIFY
ncbi:hypothetical protein FE257_013031 [Aspergillus nanangensis]|uniref:Monooxygenase n=1 Tax=Aspergillus nanangensis TaxID=2582783 RepID=A0AAD4GPJ6_ASPNN|nr:hypothetical protein FE257_013031 [Aspergillus nanangensis]